MLKKQGPDVPSSFYFQEGTASGEHAVKEKCWPLADGSFRLQFPGHGSAAGPPGGRRSLSKGSIEEVTAFSAQCVSVNGDQTTLSQHCAE